MNSISVIKSKWKLSLLITISVIGTLMSCKEEESIKHCENESIGEFRLLDSSRNSIPYLENMNLKFQDSAGNQVAFELEGYHYIGSLLYSGPCEYDHNKHVDIEYVGESYVYKFEEALNSLDLNMEVRLSVNPFASEDGAADELIVYFGKNSDRELMLGVLHITVDQRELVDKPLFENSTLIDQIKLSNKTFYNVFTNNDSSCYYNYDLGLLAFKDNDGILWVLDNTMVD